MLIHCLMFRSRKHKIWGESRNLPNTDILQLQYRFAVISEAPSTITEFIFRNTIIKLPNEIYWNYV